MEMKEELYNKNGLAVMKIACELGKYRSGDRLPSVAYLAEQFNLSVGTAQYGLTFLKNKGIVNLISKGHLGTFIETLDYEQLVEYAGIAEKACVMPLPYSLRYEGLAAAFFELGNFEGKFYLAFMNGASRRIQALLAKRYDCVLLSRKAAEVQKEQGTPIEIAVSYGLESFLTAHVLVYRGNKISEIETLGIDPESTDQTLLAQEFLKTHPQVHVVDLPYSRIVNRLESGQVDATIWNYDYMLEHHPLLKYAPLDYPETHTTMTEAVLAIRLGDKATAEYLCSRFSKEAVCAIQQKILTGEQIPEY